MLTTKNMLNLFVYGTLKRGFWNYERFCGGAVTAEAAVVRGRLFQMPSGIPVLMVPEEDILAVGTINPLADVATQARVMARMPESAPTSCRRPPEEGESALWRPVHGELLTFDDPETRLPAIDRLEGFRPDGSCLYRRVLCPVQVRGTVLAAWLYMGGNGHTENYRELAGGIWP